MTDCQNGKKVDDFYLRTRVREDGHSRFILRVTLKVRGVIPVSYTHLDVYKRQ